MVEVDLTEIRINAATQEALIILTERDGDRHLAMAIGQCEANAIKHRVWKIVPTRPLTHDLLASVIAAMSGEVEQLVVNDLKDGTFFAQLTILQDGEEILIDSRPSDGIALALRVGCPIYVEEHVLERNQEEGG